jgi:RecA-family ATPase
MMMDGKKQTRLDLRTALDLTAPLPELDFVLPGLLAGTVGMIIGPGGTGKTFWMIQAAISIASQEQMIPFFGGVWEAQKYTGRVVLLLAEDPLDILFHRVRAIGKWLSVDYNIPKLTAELEDKLEIHSLIGYQPCLMDSDGKANRLWLDTVRRAAEGARLLGIDPLRRWHRGDEIDNGLMMYLIQLLEEIAKDSGCTILFSHHVDKLSMINGSGGEQGAARGASALTDGVRWQLNLVKMNKEEAGKLGVEENMKGHFVRMEVSKSNYGISIEPVWLRREDGGVLSKAVFTKKPSRKENKDKPYEKALEGCPA